LIILCARFLPWTGYHAVARTRRTVARARGGLAHPPTVPGQLLPQFSHPSIIVTVIHVQ
jgi:hypothetical protein